MRVKTVGLKYCLREPPDKGGKEMETKIKVVEIDGVFTIDSINFTPVVSEVISSGIASATVKIQGRGLPVWIIKGGYAEKFAAARLPNGQVGIFSLEGPEPRRALLPTTGDMWWYVGKFDSRGRESKRLPECLGDVPFLKA